MLGAIAGDIIGSLYEHADGTMKRKQFQLFQDKSHFTDDTVLTVAVAQAIMHNLDYSAVIKQYGRQYPNAGYGGYFRDWLYSAPSRPYNSFGNGSAMRASPIGWAFHSVDEVLREAQRSAECTHNHLEGIKGAQAVALAVFYARTGKEKDFIKAEIEKTFDYELSRTLDEIRPTYRFDVTCQGSVPESIIAFLESTDVEDAIRNAVSLGGDTDTMGCIAGAIAEAFYGELPEWMKAEVFQRLNADFMVVIENFYRFLQSQSRSTRP